MVKWSQRLTPSVSGAQKKRTFSNFHFFHTEGQMPAPFIINDYLSFSTMCRPIFDFQVETLLLWFDFNLTLKNTQPATSTHRTPSQLHFKSVIMRVGVCLSWCRGLCVQCQIKVKSQYATLPPGSTFSRLEIVILNCGRNTPLILHTHAIRVRLFLDTVFLQVFTVTL
jgi:hypothetical protein